MINEILLIDILSDYFEREGREEDSRRGKREGTHRRYWVKLSLAFDKDRLLGTTDRLERCCRGESYYIGDL